MKLTRSILVIGEPTRTGHVFDYSTINNIVEKFVPGIHCGVGLEKIPPPLNISEEYASHVILGLYIDNLHLMANIELLDTPLGELLKHTIMNDESMVSFHLAGFGTVNEDDSVRGFRLDQIYAEYGSR